MEPQIKADVSLANAVRYHARWRPESAAVKYGDRVLSWSELDRSTSELAAGLRARGVGHGDRVGCLSLNSVEYVELVTACMKLGAVFVPLNVRLVAKELSWIIDHAGCSVVVVDGTLLPRIDEARGEIGDIQYFCTDTDVPSWAEPFEALRMSGGQDPMVPVGVHDVLFICYTSGTTGLPKGAMLTHGSVERHAQHRILADHLTADDVGLLVYPLAFTGGVVSFWMPVYVVGATLVLEQDFEPGRALDLIEQEGVSFFIGVPVIWEQLALHDRFHTADLSSLRACSSGGAPVPESLLKTWQERGVGLGQGYGLTEGSGFSIGLPAHDALDKLGFAGVPLMHTRAKVVRDDGSAADVGEVGELCLSGPDIMLGYWNDPEATAGAIRDGWLHTGDMALVDEEGYFKIVDRKKDMFQSGGLNVYPAEIERVIFAYPGVQEVAVIGVPNEKWGEVPAAVVYTQGEELNIDDLIAYCHKEMADYKVPKHVIVREKPLPRNMSQKVLKRELREEYDLPGHATVGT